jgi:small acid-soluble spore protein B (major beta-type SASP)
MNYKFHEEMILMANNSSNSSNNLLVPGVAQALDQMKYEIATEFGVQLGGETTSRANGSVGGEITKRLVQMAEQSLGGRI